MIHALLLCLVTGSSLPHAAIPDVFTKVGNEREITLDRETNNSVIFLSSPEYTSTIFYPTCRTWTRDGRFVLFESERPAPGQAAPRSVRVNFGAAGTRRYTERQLMAVHVATGDQFHLATLGVEEADNYGAGHLNVSSQFHADYAPLAERIVYYDMTGHHLYTLDLRTGRTREIWHMKDGTIGDPPSISEDGTRIVFYAGHPGPPENDWFRGDTFTIYGLDLDPVTGDPKGRPYIITSYTSRKGPRYLKDPRDWMIINHCQINPRFPDVIGYAHQYGGHPSDGSYHHARIWVTNIDGSNEGPLVLTPAGRYHTHEVWGPTGEWMYYVDTREVARVHRTTRRVQAITSQGGATFANHITVSPDERTIVADTLSSEPFDADDNRMQPLLRIDIATGRTEVLTRQLVGRVHPRHAHPNFSPDGKNVAFTVAAGKTSRIAVLPLPPDMPRRPAAHSATTQPVR